MALTDMEKVQNKAARLVRDRAHRERVALLRSAIQQAENAPEVLRAREEYEQAARAGQELLDRRNAHMDTLRAEIREMERRLEQYKKNDRQELVDFTARSRSLARAFRETLQTKVREAEAAFPDLSGAARNSVSCWQIPQEVQDEMERAWQNAGQAETNRKE